MSDKVRVVIGGDFFPSSKNKELDCCKGVFGNSLDLFTKADMSIINLEAPVTTSTEGIRKTGPNIKLKPSVISLLEGANIDLVTLANNHIRDFGDSGVIDTINHLKNSKVSFVGAGGSLALATNAFVKTVKGIRISVVNFAENEWASAEVQCAGANPMNLIDNLNQIKNAKESSDVVIVIVHGGHEFNHNPSPRMVSQYRCYADHGASMVVGHHTHCVSSHELYNDVPIFYSIGNLFFPSTTKFEGWYEGMLVSASIDKDFNVEIELIPFEQSVNNNAITIMTENKSKVFFEKLENLNEILACDSRLNKEWTNYCEKQSIHFLSFLITLPLFGKICRKIGFKIPRFFYNSFLLILNLFRCEAHRDVMLTVLDKYSKEKNGKKE